MVEERIRIPASIYEWKASEVGQDRALAVQLENRHKFQQAFSRGLAVVGFDRDAEGNGVFALGPLTQLEPD
jgi:predicted GNAT superfamily acetyltransferase